MARWGECAGALALLVVVVGCATREAPAPRPASRLATPVARAPSRPPAATPAETDRQSPARDACAPLHVGLPPLVADKLDPPLVDIEDPDDRALAPLFERLAAVARDRARGPVRIGFFGDSNLTPDRISGFMRRGLQKMFGDGGHGFVGVGKPWSWYEHQDVKHRAVGAWATYAPTRVRLPHADYGYAGILGATREQGARAIFETSGAASPVGRSASRFGVFYAVRSKGGPFDVRVDGATRQRFETRQGTAPVGYAVVDVPDASHRFEVVAASKREIRILGVTLERSQGVVLDCLGIGGVSWYDLAHFDKATSLGMLEKRPYDLVLFLLGANTFHAGDNPDAVARTVAMLREMRSNVSIVIMTPPDHVKHLADGYSDPAFVRIAQALHRAARDSHVAFWDFRQAMGGDGSMGAFALKGLAGGDLYHFSKRGAAFMGSRALHALLVAYQRYVTAHPRAGCGDAT